MTTLQTIARPPYILRTLLALVLATSTSTLITPAIHPARAQKLATGTNVASSPSQPQARSSTVRARASGTHSLVAPLQQDATKHLDQDCPYPFVFGPHYQGQNALLLFDTAGSVPSPDIHAALAQIALNVRQAVVPGQDVLNVYTRWISHTSRSASAVIATTAIPAVAPYPLKPSLNPFLSPVIRDCIMEHYQMLVRATAAQLATARYAATTLAKLLEQQPIVVDRSGKDLTGALLLANMVFRPRTHNIVFLFSDDQPQGPQSDTVGLNLESATVYTVQFCALQAAQCHAAQDKLMSLLRHLNPGWIGSYDSSSLPLLTHILVPSHPL